MRVAQLTIERFRGVKSAKLHFSGHALFIGTNNVGKSSVCEALDLVLGPDRLSRFPPVEEFDFYNAEYRDAEGNPLPLRVEVVLTDLSSEVENACGTHLEFWNEDGQRTLDRGEIAQADAPRTTACLRIETVGQYNIEEDEFEAQTNFCHGQRADGSPEQVGKRIKRMLGFIYLRTLRTGSRALSLERGSLLDIILRVQGVKVGLWERVIKRLRELEPPIGNDADELTPVLENIEKRLAQYIQLNAKGAATGIYVSQLTREHLRKTLSFFLSTNVDQEPVPFQDSGTGTLNTLVLALLSFIADAKPDNVIFAMEEPEIALPPHTQRRISNYLLNDTAQCFVTSHSPYVIERFGPDQLHILRRDNEGTLSATPVKLGDLKPKHYRRHARRGVAEAMLGAGVIVAEGITEQSALHAVAAKLEESDDTLWPLDVAGVTIFPVDGDGDLLAFGTFFKSLGLGTYAFFDKKKRTAEETAKFAVGFDLPCETAYDGIEKLLAEETPADRHWEFLAELRKSGVPLKVGIPAIRPEAPQLKDLILATLKSSKGSGYAGELIELCNSGELPTTIVTFLMKIYARYPKPKSPEVLPPVAAKPAEPGAAVAGA